MAWRWTISMPISPRTARGCNPHCVEPARGLRGPREAMPCRCLEKGYAACHLTHALIHIAWCIHVYSVSFDFVQLRFCPR
eukprot:3347764-Prymnesium_polylepis.1